LSKERPKLNLLVAYPYMSRSVIECLIEHKDKIRFLLDSGAFTAWKKGSTINLDDYCKFIEKLPITPWRYFNLDVVGNPKESFNNYQKMLERGFTPMPVFTRGEDVSMLEEYYKTSDVVAIGGLVKTNNNAGFVKGIMSKVKDRKVHLLGFAKLDFLKTYKPYMADSSRWANGALYGLGDLYLGNGLPFVIINRENLKKHLRNPRVMDAIQMYGLNTGDLLDKKNWHGYKNIMRILSARSYRKFSDDASKNLGVNLFLAAGNKQSVNLLLEEY
jgi:hypothetical protein